MASTIVAQITLEAGSVGDQQFSNEAEKRLAAGKYQPVYKPLTTFGLSAGAAPTTTTWLLFVASVSGRLRGFRALLNLTGTNTSVSFNLLRNGASVLVSPIVITHGNVNRQVVSGTISDAALSPGDVLSVEMVSTSAIGASGAMAFAEITENGTI